MVHLLCWLRRSWVLALALFASTAFAAADTTTYSDWLARYITTVDGLNTVAYPSVTPTDRQVLKDYIAATSQEKPSAMPRAAQMAYWINLYNALTLDVILDRYPVASIRDIRLSGPFKPGPWDKKLITVEGRQLSLNNIEHDILRKDFADPRVHYAVNCASIGCPNLQKTAWTADNLEAMLEAAATDFVNSPRGVQVDAQGRLTVSSIYHWFGKDFGSSDSAIIAHLSKYAQPPLKAQLQQTSKISDHQYDWSLNLTPAK